MSLFRRVFRGAESLLGGFGRKIISTVQRVGGTVSDAISAIARTGVQPEPLTVVREWYEERKYKDRVPAFGILAPEQAIPRDLYTEKQIWGEPKFAYTVNFYGQDLATGRITSEDRYIWTSRELTKAEILDEAVSNMGREGGSPQFAVWNVQVTGAAIRAGDYFN